MKIIIAIPAVKNIHITRECLDSVAPHPVDLLLCQNGADDDIKALFQEYYNNYPHKIKILDVPVNNGLNPVFNLFLEHFISNDYDYMAIINNDIILQHDWLNVIRNRIFIHGDNESFMPTEVDKRKVFERIPNVKDVDGASIQGGVAGIFMWFNKKHAECVYPVPEEIKIWYGDNWCYEILRKMGYPTLMLDNFQCFHHGSATLKEMTTTSALIEADKIAWNTTVKQQLEERIRQLTTTT